MECVNAELREDAVRRLRQAIGRVQEFLRRHDRGVSVAADPTRTLCASLCAEAQQFLRRSLSRSAPSEHTLRTAYRLAAALGSLVASNAPAVAESTPLNSFPLAFNRDVVAYARYGGAEIVAQEAAYTSMLGIDAERARLLLTSSGMAAYALIETFLLREVLRSGDRILLNPGIYFETRHQLQSLPFFERTIACGSTRMDMLDGIVEHRPRVVFVDPLTNSSELRLIDLPQLLDDAEEVCERETWFVIDGTLLSGSFDPFAKPRRCVRVLYYESGCKYLQFGMDLGPAGLVVVEAALSERFEQLRRGIGAIGSDALVLPRASRQAYLNYLRAQTACAQAVARAATVEYSSSARCIIEPVHPLQVSHPDHAEARKYLHLGGVLVFRFARPPLNRRRPLEDFIDLLIDRARSAKLPLTAGVSFGFCVPRIGAAWSSYEVDEAFLRLSAGIDLALAAALGRLVVECAHKFVAKAVH
jgi:cystathionine gamma-synthase